MIRVISPAISIKPPEVPSLNELVEGTQDLLVACDRKLAVIESTKPGAVTASVQDHNQDDQFGDHKNSGQPEEEDEEANGSDLQEQNASWDRVDNVLRSLSVQSDTSGPLPSLLEGQQPMDEHSLDSLIHTLDKLCG